MNKGTLLIAGVALAAGILAGVLFMKGGDHPSSPPAAQMPSGTAPATSAIPNSQSEIKALEELVAADPQNRGAWVSLGNLYFDTDQAVKAVDAYDKALQLDPNDPNVLTDQGVMFRRLGWFDRAVENFAKAASIDPSHGTSLFNLGIVYRYDLQQFDKAEEAWSRFLAAQPTGPVADKVRSELEFLKGHPTVPQQK